MPSGARSVHFLNGGMAERNGGRQRKRAVEKTMDIDRLLEGEDPESPYLEDAQHWASVYGELLSFKEDLLSTARQRLARMSEGSAKKEVTGTDVQILEVERDRLRRRLDFWELRIRKIERGGGEA
jgi:hypothetical protein